MAINIIPCKDAIFLTGCYDVVLVGTNIYNMLTNGFQSKIRFKFPEVDEANNRTGYGDTRKLGKRLTIDGKPTISLMYISNYPNSKRVTIDYDALEHAMKTANSEFAGKRVMTTMIGCTAFDGNGDKEHVMEILGRNSDKIELDICDYTQMDRATEMAAYRRMLGDKFAPGHTSKTTTRDRLNKVLQRVYLK